MAKYIVNIELENAEETDYDKLASELEKVFFKNESYTKKQVAYMNGYSIFSKSSEIGLQDVSSDVKKAAATTGKKFSFFVTRQRASN